MPALPGIFTAPRESRGATWHLLRPVFIGVVAIVAGSCEDANPLEPDVYCMAPQEVVAFDGPVQVFAAPSLGEAALVVEESTAPGCQPWDWNGDHTACINATLRIAHDEGTRLVGLTRGRSYRYSGRIEIPPHIVLGAVGDTTRSRPILATSTPVLDGLALGNGAEIRELDIRGPHYNTTDFKVNKHRDWLYKGVNGATSSGWSIIGSSVNGFAGTGVLASRSNDVRIEGSTISHNGYSGISLFDGDGDCGRRIRIVGNLIEKNGQDGVDACSSEVRFEKNTFRYNGWDRNGGDRNGLLIFAWSPGGADKIKIVGNRAYGNGESGIRISGNHVTGVVIRENHLSSNGHWGLDPGAPNGTLAGVAVQNNTCGRNRLGCLNRRYPDGLEVIENTCFR